MYKIINITLTKKKLNMVNLNKAILLFKFNMEQILKFTDCQKAM